ncbi:uncharacterized protein N7482_000796 [Penicillium canariense]|uniref:Fork-head domain-containing protein n=1 Tax=Penicillium canariense TaxID=189055 RepID=A0A9W9LTA1_9EURO|nr:uncharacterized protein N7482_000796 [Penicillium canariense]KAJ5174919.1 hypothetical protein N7482_000796 [Penicillium canariense]
MDRSSPSYHHPLAQMPTDQREHEQHRLLVQTVPPLKNWADFTSNLVPESMIPLHQARCSDPWGATGLEPYEFSTSSLARALVPESTYLPPFYTAPHANMSSLIASSASVESLRPRMPRHREQDDLMDWQTAPATASFVHQEHFHPPPSHGNISERSMHPMRATPPSPPISISSDHSPSRSHNSMSPAATMPVRDSTSPGISLGDTSDQEPNSGPPYSRLIWEALMSTEEKMLPLQGIYQWFGRNTTKGRNETSKGWQNSIRHNLSMNAGFEAIKVEVPGKKAMNYWRLTGEAIRNGGVQSTTRYRKLSGKKVISSDPLDHRRPRPGSKGGSKNAAKGCHGPPGEQPRLPPQYERPLPIRPHLHRPPFETNHPPSFPPMPHYGVPPHIPNSLPQLPCETCYQFDFGNVIGTTGHPPNDNALFGVTAEGEPDCAAFVGSLGWYPLGLDHGLMTGPPEGVSD